jgi:hypothetical protein
MRAVVIDSENQKVFEVSIGTDFNEIYPLIGNGCSTFAVPVVLHNGDALYADDEGLLQEDIKGGFIMKDWNYPIVGNAVLLNVDEEGESCDAVSDVEDLNSQIEWVSQRDAKGWAEYALRTPPQIYTF